MNLGYPGGFRSVLVLLLLPFLVALQSCSGNGGEPQSLEFHQAYFIKNNYEGTATCLQCHNDAGNHILQTGHWNWQGVASNVQDHETEYHGKNNMINNFCIAVPSNEGRCTQCHIGYGYADNSYDFGKTENIDCLVCHDQTGTYKKSKTAAGAPESSIDLRAVARSVGSRNGIPQRSNCIGCHASAGGGDNVKHGDLSSSLVSTSRLYDVHMGTDGGNFSCVKCHEMNRSTEGDPLDHGIAGMPFHSVDEGSMKQCSDCHGDTTQAHENKDMGTLFVSMSGSPQHQRLACQVCHIPKFAQQVATKTDWDWSSAGQDIDPIPVDPASGRATYDKKKGSFVWEYNVRPVLRVHNGKWNKTMVNVNDQYSSLPAILASPAASPTEPTAKIYPFKKMTGKQIADAGNKTLLVPHLFGTAGGENPYWVKYDWHLALQDGANYTGQTYSGAYEFVNTEMLLSVNHEVAPAVYALGKDGDCADCHSPGLIDWPALGWTEDPYKPGGGN